MNNTSNPEYKGIRAWMKEDVVPGVDRWKMLAYILFLGVVLPDIAVVAVHQSGLLACMAPAEIPVTVAALVSHVNSKYVAKIPRS